MMGQELQREDAKASQVKKRPVCGKCGSGPVYRDDDPLNGGVYALACIKCGNRYPGGPMPVFKDDGDIGIAENKTDIECQLSYPEGPAPVFKDTQKVSATENKAGIEHQISKSLQTKRVVVKSMKKSVKEVKPCANCSRLLTIEAKGLCGICYKSQNHLQGKEREAVLAEIRSRTKDGVLRQKNHKHSAECPIPGSPLPKKAKSFPRHYIARLECSPQAWG